MVAKLDFHKSWENIFNKNNLLRLLRKIRQNGFVDISADELKAVDGKEPRLLTKIYFKKKPPNDKRAIAWKSLLQDRDYTF